MTRKKIASAALLGGLTVTGLGVGAATLAYADPSASPTPSASATASPDQQGQQGQQGRGGRGMHDGQEAKDLAAKLGVDEAKVTEALKAIHDEEHAANQGGTATGDKTTKPDPATREADLAKKLAEKLGVDQAKVSQALTEVRQAHQADEKSRFSARLDTAVKDGKLTQAEAQAVQKAADAGVIGMGGGR